MKREAAVALNEALNEAQNANGPIEAYQLLEEAVIEALGYSGVFRISRDDDPQDPRDCVNLSTLHLRFANSQIGDHGSRPPSDYNDGEIIFKRKIYGYSHSGLVLSPNEFNCKFDSGLAGWQYVTREMAIAWGVNCGVDESTAETEKIFDKELKAYNKFLGGGGYWAVQVLGDGDVYHVEADTFQELLEEFDHESLRGRSPDAARQCLEAAWDRRDTLEPL